MATLQKFIFSLIVLTTLQSSMLLADDAYVPSVDVNEVTIKGIRLISKEVEILNILGPPANVVNHGLDEVVGGVSKTIYYDGLQIYLINQEIYGLECNGSLCVTNKGIHIGDTRKEIEDTYGMPSEYESSGGRIGYTFKINGTYIDSSLVFFLEDNKLTRMLYHVDYT